METRYFLEGVMSHWSELMNWCIHVLQCAPTSKFESSKVVLPTLACSQLKCGRNVVYVLLLGAFKRHVDSCFWYFSDKEEQRRRIM